MVKEVKTTERLTLINLLSKDEYLIPLYQRNYAWGRDEIFQLLNDIDQSRGSYYLGTLVVSKKEIAQDKFQYEIIDGQQRHTTLSIINAVFKNRSYIETVVKRNLYFEVRDKCEDAIDDILNNKLDFKDVSTLTANDAGVRSIINACKIVDEFLFEKFNNEAAKIKGFANRFYYEVHIFRAELPKGTDLNHYFEIMNNRGEQLEKHEILKAAFMKDLDDNDQYCFSTIWDACSNMNSHVQINLTEENGRKILFGESYQELNFKKFSEKNENIFTGKENIKIIDGDEQMYQGEDNEIEDNLTNIISTYQVPINYSQTENDNFVDKFISIIDFPNFLLQVLKLDDEKVRLDDKSLLDDFGYKNDLLPDSMLFVEKLLRYRLMFDRYIVKREGVDNEWSWSLKKAMNEDNLYKTTFEDENDRRKLRMIQTMFNVTFSANSYKNWMFDIMKFFKKSYSIEIESSALLNLLDCNAEEYFNKIKSEDIFHAGLNTPRFVFNYLDYLLWIRYYEKVRGDKNITMEKDYINLSIEKYKSSFNNFKFVQRTSIEHLYPQSRMNDLKVINGVEKAKVLDSFGNLCLISASSNSSYNSDLPTQKKNDFKGRNESLKQLIMFANFNGENWNTVEINKHHEEMKKLIFN